MSVTTSVKKGEYFTVSITKTNMDLLTRLPEYIRGVLLREIPRQSRALASYIIDTFLSGPKGPYTLAKRSGELRRNTRPLTATVVGQSVVGGVVIGEGLPYTHVHVGPMDKPATVITPRTAKALAIPIEPGPAVTATGRLMSRFAGGLRNVPNLFRGSEEHNLRPDVLYLRMPGNRVVPAFVLRRSVKQRTRVFPEVIAYNQQDTVNEALTIAINDAMRSRFGG